MTPAARLSAAIELIETIDSQRVPAAQALKEWGTAHRFAGSGDRAAIAGLVWDVLRRRASSAWIMGSFAPPSLTEAERTALSANSLEGAPAHVAGDYPEWLDPHLAEVFGEDRAAEAAAMASRAPPDPPVNSLKAKREKGL